MSAPHVTIAGGGLAGLAAALRLAERDYQVTLYEEKEMLGGNLASRTLRNSTVIDVYPHMYQAWYRNFWQLMDDIGVDREKSFTEFHSFHQMRRPPGPGEPPPLATVTDVYSARHVVDNLLSGVAPPADALVAGYASLDLLAEQLNPTMFLENMSLTGFLNTRTYMTKAAIEAYEAFVTRVWAIPAYLISAADCHAYLTYCVAEPDTGAFLARGPAEDIVIKPLTKALEDAKVRIVRQTRVDAVIRKDDRVVAIKLEGTRFDPRHEQWVGTGEYRTEAVDDLLLAVPAEALSKLVRSGNAGERIVDANPKLAEVLRLTSQRVPMLHVCFNRKLEHVPTEPMGPVALFRSELSLAFTDISQVWESPEFTGRTVLAVSCSEPYALAGAHPPEDGHTIMCELAEYLDFEAGEKWEDPASKDVDWRLTRYHSNLDARLSINAIGTDAWRPGPSCEGLANLFFAGDFCQHDFGITTLEAAAATGLNAAHEIVKARGRGPEIAVLKPNMLPEELYLLNRYAWLPAALAAKAWALPGELGEKKPVDAKDEGSLLRYLLTPGLPARHRHPGS
ncbi:MAG: phytoene desaturase [Solirubrobacterales bacterium]|nr:phytoene desaturase [Solirubrobacterales bacterium]